MTEWSNWSGLESARPQRRQMLESSPFEWMYGRAKGLVPLGELGDGRPVLILDPVALANGVSRPRKLAFAPVLARS